MLSQAKGQNLDDPYAPIDSTRIGHFFVSVHEHLLHFEWDVHPEIARQAVADHLLEDHPEINRPLVQEQLLRLRSEINFILRKSHQKRESREILRDLVNQINEYAQQYELDRAEIASNLVQQIQLTDTLIHVQHPLETLHTSEGNDLDKSILLHRLLSEMDYHSSVLHVCTSLKNCELNTMVGIQKANDNQDREHLLLVETRTPSPFSVFPRSVESANVIKITDKRHGKWQAGTFPHVEKQLNRMENIYGEEFEYQDLAGRLAMAMAFLEAHPTAGYNPGKVQVLRQIQELWPIYQQAEKDSKDLYEIACASITQELDEATLKSAIDELAAKRFEVQRLAAELGDAMHLWNAFLMQSSD